MSTPLNLMQNPAHAPSQLQTQQMELKQHEIKSLGQSKLSEAEKAAKLRETCESFESIFIQKIWQQMRATLPQENPLVGKEEKFWQSMYDQEFSKHMSKSGGIGLADMMYEQLSENLFNVTKTTADATQQNKGFEINVAPMLPVKSALAQANDVQSATGQNVADSSNGAKQNNPSNDKFSTLYENINAIPAMSPTHSTSTAMQNTESVQQFLQGLQAKQGIGAQTTGPQRAQQAAMVAGNEPPLHGVLPAPTVPQVVRYTTNVPANARKNNAEDHLKELLAKTSAQQGQAAYMQGQSWGQASPQQQANLAVQQALRQAHDGSTATGQVASPFVPPVANPLPTNAPIQAIQPFVAGTVSANPLNEQTNAQALPYTVPPVTSKKQQS